MTDAELKQAMAELQEVVRCRCDEAYRDRGLHDPQCECDSAEAVKIVARRIEALTKERDEGMTEALSLAKSLHEQFYQEQVPQWEPLEDVAGVISQIDNMVAGIAEQLAAARQDAKEAEVYAEELEKDRDALDAKLAKAVEALEKAATDMDDYVGRGYGDCFRDTLAEIKGEKP